MGARPAASYEHLSVRHFELDVLEQVRREYSALVRLLFDSAQAAVQQCAPPIAFAATELGQVHFSSNCWLLRAEQWAWNLFRAITDPRPTTPLPPNSRSGVAINYTTPAPGGPLEFNGLTASVSPGPGVGGDAHYFEGSTAERGSLSLGDIKDALQRAAGLPGLRRFGP